MRIIEYSINTIYVNFRTELGDIDNSSLIEKIISNDCFQLKTGLRHVYHFEMIPKILWMFFRKYYRCHGTIISRKIIYKGNLKKPELDLYPVHRFSFSFSFLIFYYLVLKVNY